MCAQAVAKNQNKGTFKAFRDTLLAIILALLNLNAAMVLESSILVVTRCKIVTPPVLPCRQQKKPFKRGFFSRVQ